MSPRPAGPLAALLLLLAPLWVLAVRQALAAASPWSPAPDALLAAAAAAAWSAPAGRAALFAAVTGCLADASCDAPFGLLGARLAALVALFAPLRRGVEAGAPGQVVLVLAFAAAERSLAALTLALTAPEPVSVAALLPRAGWTALATALLAPLAFGAARALLPPERR
ncbi:MAG: hypothetical protein M9894_23365 [Planctomycetes bacterium]|nr:hypothetical protein [Planctomycetota bacterium]